VREMREDWVLIAWILLLIVAVVCLTVVVVCTT